MTATATATTPEHAQLAAARRYRAIVADVLQVLELAAEACVAPVAALKLISNGEGDFTATFGLCPDADKPALPPVWDLLTADDQPVTADDANNSSLLETGHWRLAAAAPLHYQGHLVGALCVFDTHPRPGDSEKIKRVLAGLARRVDTETDLRHALTRQPFPVAADQDDIVTAISHEIRTPLASIRGNLELLTDTPGAIAPGFERRIDVITRNAGRLCRTVDSLLRVAAQQLQAPVGERRPIDVKGVMSAAVAAMDDSAGRLHTELPDGPVWAVADPQLLQIAIGHLIDNALRYSDEDKIVSVVVTADPQPAIIIGDQGPGLDPAYAGIAGTPFARGEQARSQQTPGLGLGLTIARGIAEAQGGAMLLDSIAGQGLTARITLTPPTSALR